MGTVAVKRGEATMRAVGREPRVSAMTTAVATSWAISIATSIMIASSGTAMGTSMMTHAMIARAVRVAGRGNDTRNWNKREKPY